MSSSPSKPDKDWRALRQLELESLYELIREGFDSNEAAERHAERGWDLGVRAPPARVWPQYSRQNLN